ncbi:major facilitator superfamily domain-containing protein [Aspergillus undulatus]|uniref:major facilitator superfamily domain-containing protein n=1 Tax=Aspergillus undulatus TaxID=1810928 RepID=UPI003CCD0EEF
MTDHNMETFKPDRRLWCIFGVIGLLNFAASLDATSLSVALPTIAEDLDGTAIEAFWAGTSFLVASTVFQPTFAMFSDLFGRKWTLFTAVVAFTIGSILAGAAPNLKVLLGGRVIQGIGGGGIIALTEVLIADLIPLRERGKWMGFRALTWALGTVIGPIIGGALAESAWRWIFWLNLPFCGLGLLGIPVFLKLRHDPISLREKLRQVDYAGAILFTASLTSFLIPLSWGGVMYDWNSWRTLVPLILGGVGMVAFTVFECYVSARPLIPMAIFRTPTIVINYLACLLHGAILFCILYYLPLYYEASLGYTAIIAGAAILPLTLTVAPLSAIASILVSITGRYRWALWSGWALTTLGLGLLYLLDSETTITQWIFLTLVSGLGLGTLFSTMMLAVQASADPKFLSITASMSAFFRTLGQTMGVAIGGVVFQNRIHHEFSINPRLSEMADDLTADAAGLVKHIQSLNAADILRVAMEVAYADALKVVWLFLCGLAAVGLVGSFFVKGYSMNQAFKPSQGIEGEGTSGGGTTTNGEMGRVKDKQVV